MSPPYGMAVGDVGNAFIHSEKAERINPFPTRRAEVGEWTAGRETRPLRRVLPRGVYSCKNHAKLLCNPEL